MTIQPILGTLSTEEFLAEYWQKKPLLIRDAFPNFESPLTPDELAGLSLEEEVESRIVFEKGESSPWEIQHGPFDEKVFAQLPESCWSLLVQGADLWVPEVKALLPHFNFLPPWRVDDVMVSYAPAGGSVGPHFDYYDVFLLQGQGQRRWQVGQFCDQQSPLVAGTPLRILQAFEVVDEWVLHPGDMLYLPPGFSHWGVAENDCLTYSIGFRSPSLTDMLDDLTTELMTQGNSCYYRDPPLIPSMATEAIDPAFIEQVQAMLREMAEDKTLLGDWFARYMTAPKYPELVDEADVDRRATIDGRRYLNGERVDK